MNISEFLAWFYTKGIDYYLKSWSISLNWILHYFSLGLLLKTLFSPWKRLIDVDKSPGFNFQKKFETFTFNLVSRGIGAVVRLTLFWVGIIFIVVASFGGAIGFVFWLILPFFGLPIYQKYKLQPKNYIADLLFKLKSSVKNNPLEIILNSSAGQFLTSHLAVTQSDLLLQANLENVDFGNIKAQSFSELISYLLNQKVWTKKYLNIKKLSEEDILLVAEWWDQEQTTKTKFGEDEFGRPGIALELTFGYTPTLNKYSVDLSLPLSYSHRLIGRQPIVSRMDRVLNSGNSVLLVGDPGVGKKTVVLEFAKRAASGQLGRSMSFSRVLELDYNSLLSESKDLNTKKNILSSILAEASYAGNIILMIRDIHRLTNPELEGYDFTDIFEEHLENRVLKIIAVSGNDEYEKYLSQNLRLRKYLEKVEITPPSKEDAMLILIQAAQRWETLTGFTITMPALRNILEESDKYVTEVPFPEKAIELLDAVVTYKEQAGGNIIEITDTNKVLSEKTGISFESLTQEEETKLGNIEEIIHQHLVDQESAVSLIGKTLRAKTIGVIQGKRPLGSFLFLGPTGVGKTETAKVLSKVYFGGEDKIIRFDMAEYAGTEGLERLIGSVGKNQPGALTTAIKNHPASLLLLDELEKATKEIYNLFLSLLDEGIITDAFGKKIICRNLFVVGTSNAGAEYIRQLVAKGDRGEDLQKGVVNYVLENQLFSPEFLNRFDGVVVYEPLGQEELVKIAKLMLTDLAKDLKSKNVYLQVTEEACQKLAKDGYDPAFGARAMRRIVNISLGDAISKSLIKKEIVEGDKFKLTPCQNKEEFIVEKVN